MPDEYNVKVITLNIDFYLDISIRQTKQLVCHLHLCYRDDFYHQHESRLPCSPTTVYSDSESRFSVYDCIGYRPTILIEIRYIGDRLVSDYPNFIQLRLTLIIIPKVLIIIPKVLIIIIRPDRCGHIELSLTKLIRNIASSIGQS